MLPFAVVAVLWFFLRSRTLKGGWLCAIIALLGFAGGLAPWIVRNHQDLQDIIPVSDSAGYHLWVGNNPQATGGPFDPKMEAELEPKRKKELADISESQRYFKFLDDVKSEVTESPTATFQRRIHAFASYFVGDSVLQGHGAMVSEANLNPPSWVEEALYGTVLAIVVLGLLGWRWSYGWKFQSSPLGLALFWIPLPYILGHAEFLCGPRLPLDGPLMCLVALGLVCLVPGLGANLLKGEEFLKTQEEAGQGT
jgi:hypothetical protein